MRSVSQRSKWVGTISRVQVTPGRYGILCAVGWGTIAARQWIVLKVIVPGVTYVYYCIHCLATDTESTYCPVSQK